jgi:hypothetical protein
VGVRGLEALTIIERRRKVPNNRKEMEDLDGDKKITNKDVGSETQEGRTP